MTLLPYLIWRETPMVGEIGFYHSSQRDKREMECLSEDKDMMEMQDISFPESTSRVW